MTDDASPAAKLAAAVGIVKVTSPLTGRSSEVFVPFELAGLLSSPPPSLTPPPERELPLILGKLKGSAPEQIHVIEDFLSAESCARMCGLIEVEYQRNPTLLPDDRHAHYARTSEPFMEELKALFLSAFTKAEQLFGVKLESFEQPQPLRYGKGGFYGLHVDSHNADKTIPGQITYFKTHDRDISAILYLNDDFEGGLLYFKNQQMRLKPKPGMLVLFPSHDGYMHAAEPTTNDMARYVLVSWADAKGVAKVKERRKSNILMESARVAYAPIQSEAAPARPLEPIAPASQQRGGKDGIMQMRGVISQTLCDEIIAASRQREAVAARIAGRGVDPKIRNARDIDITGLTQKLNEMMAGLLRTYIEPFFGVSVECWEKISLLRYEPGGKYLAHVDGETWEKYSDDGGYWKRILDRDISILLYLNDDFTGGKLSFPDLGHEIAPEPGLLVAFPSGHEYVHKAENVESGERLVIVTWATCHGTARVRKDLVEKAVFMKNFIEDGL